VSDALPAYRVPQEFVDTIAKAAYEAFIDGVAGDMAMNVTPWERTSEAARRGWRDAALHVAHHTLAARDKAPHLFMPIPAPGGAGV
jgi:hypothetical protein